MSLGSSNQDTIGTALAVLYANACGELSTMMVDDSGRPKRWRSYVIRKGAIYIEGRRGTMKLRMQRLQL